MQEQIEQATDKDINDLVTLVNSAYRGESAKKGWTTEADLLGGIRTDKEGIEELLHKQGSVILKYTSYGHLLGCVNLQKQQSIMYLGMLTVAPDIQAQGIGRKLLTTAEQFAQAAGCSAIHMTVISVRDELIQWYQRRGYTLTEERKPFPSDNPRFGLPKRELEFVVMKKEF
jgi:ribosomal protein S18 acetylase RimI-like enzyme